MASRMIITMPASQRVAIRQEARRFGISDSEMVRRCINAQIAAPGGLAAKDAHLALVGLGEGDGRDIARHHHAAVRDAVAKRRGRIR